jgi:PAS domain S-box-containing protein
MNDHDSTREQLLATIQALRARVADLERTEAELKGAQTALRQSEDRFRVALKGSPFIVWHQDRELRFTWAYNSEPGFSATMLVGKTEVDFLPPHEAAQLASIKRRVMDTGVGTREEVPITTAEEARIYDLTVEPMRDATGAIIGVTCAALNVTARKRGEDQLREYAERQQTLSRRLLEVQEAERRHLARELHDEVGQQLTGLRLLLKQVAGGTTSELSAPSTASSDASGGTGGKLDEALALLDGLLTRVRDLSSDLRPAMLDHLGLLPALVWLLKRYTDQTGVAVDFKHANLEGRFAPTLETAAYRIVQEGMTNVARHAAVNAAAVRVWAERDVLVVQIEDRGSGFDVGVVMSGSAGGLSGIRERVTLLGGQLAIDSAPGAGTHLVARLPLGNLTEERINGALDTPGR